MKVTTYNCAGVRARLEGLLDWLATNEPDVVGLQEVKAMDEIFPRAPFEELGYRVATHGQKGFNGVAILSRLPIEDVTNGMGDAVEDPQARVIAATIAGVRIVNTYVPNGTRVDTDKWDYKLLWMERFRDYLAPLVRSDLLWIGDVNVAPGPLDVYDAPRQLGGVGHHPAEFERLAAIRELGLVDSHRHLRPDAAREYTYWDFTIPNALKRRLGWRIDHIYGTAGMIERLESLVVDEAARLETKPSDHTFVTATFR